MAWPMGATPIRSGRAPPKQSRASTATPPPAEPAETAPPKANQKSAHIVKELFKRKAEEGSTIFLSTHSVEIAEELCHRIAIITNGTLHIIGTMEELRKKAGRENQDIDLEEIFLELTGAWEMQQVIAALKEE